MGFSSGLERRDILDAAEKWLDPAEIGKIPAPLARRAILATGFHGRADLRPQLQALLEHWGEPNELESAFARARGEETVARLRVPFDLSDAALRRWRPAVRERRELESAVLPNPAALLRDAVEESLRMLDSRAGESRVP